MYSQCSAIPHILAFEVVNSLRSVHILSQNVDDPYAIPYILAFEVVDFLRSVNILSQNVDDPYAIPHIG